MSSTKPQRSGGTVAWAILGMVGTMFVLAAFTDRGATLLVPPGVLAAGGAAVLTVVCTRAPSIRRTVTLFRTGWRPGGSGRRR